MKHRINTHFFLINNNLFVVDLAGDVQLMAVFGTHKTFIVEKVDYVLRGIQCILI